MAARRRGAGGPRGAPCAAVGAALRGTGGERVPTLQAPSPAFGAGGSDLDLGFLSFIVFCIGSTGQTRVLLAFAFLHLPRFRMDLQNLQRQPFDLKILCHPYNS